MDRPVSLDRSIDLPASAENRGRPNGMHDGSSRETIAAFKAELVKGGVPATVRLTRGRDIAAACGQLATAPRERSRAPA